MVKSVREVQKSEGKRYAFEIGMKNGKKKLLAADTADLRQTWVELLWRAMRAPGERHSVPACIWQEGEELSGQGSAHSSGSEGERRERDRGRLRASSEPWALTPEPLCPGTPRAWTGRALTPEPLCPGTPRTTTKSPALGAASFDSGLWKSSLGLQEEEEEEEEEEQDAEESDYDVLPSRTQRLLQEENIYDVPLCNMRVTEETHPGYREIEESIYDVPSSLLRRLSDRSIGDQSEGLWSPDRGGVPDGDDSGFPSGTAGWTAPAPEGLTDL
ncbi:uncharacterized protein LOC133115372 isoform X2 [Conger conger]|nr:uncharacterized protein LOC133115372 isoform X2 [Conger conger]